MTPLAAPTVALCDCGHAARTHGEEDGCRILACDCAGYETDEPRPEPVKRCTKCGKDKPVDEFYIANGKRFPRCRDCDNTRTRPRTPARILRVRARHRAVAALIERHSSEFRDLLDYFVRVTTDEAAQLATTAAAREAYRPTETVRLRSGARRAGQDVTERIDVARCPECVGYHDRGHVCAACGARPEHAHPVAS